MIHSEGVSRLATSADIERLRISPHPQTHQIQSLYNEVSKQHAHSYISKLRIHSQKSQMDRPIPKRVQWENK